VKERERILSERGRNGKAKQQSNRRRNEGKREQEENE